MMLNGKSVIHGNMVFHGTKIHFWENVNVDSQVLCHAYLMIRKSCWGLILRNRKKLTSNSTPSQCILFVNNQRQANQIMAGKIRISIEFSVKDSLHSPWNSVHHTNTKNDRQLAKCDH